DTSVVQNWTGVDLSPRLLETLKFLSSGMPSGEIKTLQASCLDVDLPDESFDTICSIFLLHHLARKTRRQSSQRIERLLSKAYRMLKPGGSLVVFESWPHVLLHLYNLSFPILYPIVQKARGTELPYFFSARTLAKIAARTGFGRRHVLAVPLYETAKYPVGGFVVPGGVQPLIHKFGVYVFVK
ncbi:MAG: class I SAM-dependent methyltransferase, partial [Rhodospirillaceae bacterium]